MNINTVFVSNYRTCSIQRNKKSSDIAFCGKQESDSVEISNNTQKPHKTLIQSVLNLFDIKTGYERDMMVGRPSVLDLVVLFVDSEGKKRAALCYRYGNSNNEKIEPEVIEKVKSHLAKRGIDTKEENMKFVKMANGDITDGDEKRILYKSVSYYDEKSKKSIVFTKTGEPDYIVNYKYDLFGGITDYEFSDV